MATSLLGRSVVPRTARVPPPSAPAEEHDGGRVVRGVALGLVLSVVAWVGLGFGAVCGARVVTDAPAER
jgi:hypothetical protein